MYMYGKPWNRDQPLCLNRLHDEDAVPRSEFRNIEKPGEIRLKLGTKANIALVGIS